MGQTDNEKEGERGALRSQCRAEVSEASGVGVPPVVATAYDWGNMSVFYLALG
ncbi:MAG: hypothetical protein ACR2LR_15235 [Hassallia sp.]